MERLSSLFEQPRALRRETQVQVRRGVTWREGGGALCVRERSACGEIPAERRDLSDSQERKITELTVLLLQRAPRSVAERQQRLGAAEPDARGELRGGRARPFVGLLGCPSSVLLFTSCRLE